MSKTIGKYNVLRTLGTGASCKVKLAHDPETGRKVAIKVINDNMDQQMKKLVMTEVEAMAKLDHVNVIRQVEFGSAPYKKDSKTRDVDYIVLELALGGELFDFVANSGAFNERIARYYFKQLLEGIDHCHQQGITHRDLKPENLLLDSNYNLKIADFGFAGPVQGKDGKGNLTTKLGTLNYMAPEIHLKQPYQGRTVDLFAAAIILFIMVAAHPPFTTAEPADPFYRCIAASRADIFWRTHCKSKANTDAFFTEEFKEIVQAMLQLDPSHRPSIPEVMASKWMQGDMPTKDEVHAEFAKRDELVKAAMYEAQKEKEIEKANKVAMRAKKNMRGVGNGEEEKEEAMIDMVPLKNMEAYDKTFNNTTEFFSTYSPDMIEDALLEYVRQELKVEPTKHYKDKYKMKFPIQTKNEGGHVTNVLMQVRILKVDEKRVAVEFLNMDGDKQRFIEHYKEIKEKALPYLNDAVPV